MGAGSTAFRRNIRWQFLGTASQAVLGGLLLLLLGRYLSASSFGIYTIVLGYIYVAGALFEPRLQDIAIRQFWDVDEGPGPPHAQAFIDLLAFESIGKALPCISLVVLAPVLTHWGKLPEGSATLIAAAAIGVYLSRLGNGLATGLLRVRGRTDINALCTTVELSLRLLLTLLLVATGAMSVEGCIAVQCLTGFVVSAIQLRIAARSLSVDGSAWHQWNPAGALQRLDSHRRLILSSLALSVSDLMNKDLDVTLIAPMVAADQVGVYKMAKSIVMLTWRAVDPFYIALMPEINRLVASASRAALHRLLRRSTVGLLGLATGLSAVSFGLVVLFGDSVLGPSFGGIRGLMPWMLVGVVGGAALVWGHPLSVALNRPDIAFLGSLLSSLVGMAAFLFLVPELGLQGAGLAWSLAFLLNFLFTAAAALRCWRMQDPAAQ